MLEMAHLRAVLRYISYAKFLQFLEVPWDFHRLTLDPEIVQLPAFFILSAMFTGTMWPTREDKPCFATTLKHSAHDHETCLYKHQGTSSGMTLGTAWLESLDLASASNTSEVHALHQVTIPGMSTNLSSPVTKDITIKLRQCSTP